MAFAPIHPVLGFIGSLGWPELLLLGLLGVLIFGKRLPEVGKSIGRGIVEFKKGLSGVEEGFEDATSTRPSPQIEQHQRNAADTNADDRTNASTGSAPHSSA